MGSLKTILVLITLLLSSLILTGLTSAAIAETNMTNRTQYKDLSYWERFGCEMDLSEEKIGTVASMMPWNLAESVSSAGFSYVSGSPSYFARNKREYCVATVETMQTIAQVNELTKEIELYSGKNATQIGLEEYLFEEEKQLLLANIALAWDYVELLTFVALEIILIIFYLVQLYLISYLLLVVIPKAFLKMRDGITMFLVRNYKKRRKRYKKK